MQRELERFAYDIAESVVNTMESRSDKVSPFANTRESRSGKVSLVPWLITWRAD